MCAGAIPALVGLLDGQRPHGLEPALEALQFLACRAECRHTLVEAGAVPRLVALLASARDKLVECAIGTLASLGLVEQCREQVRHNKCAGVNCMPLPATFRRCDPCILASSATSSLLTQPISICVPF